MLPSKLPLGIRNNNPGNLRQNFSVSYPTVMEDGYAKFRSITDGAQAMAALLFAYYENHHLTTLPEIIMKYAPASENDVSRYINLVCQFAGYNPLSVKTRDMELQYAWNMVILARAMVKVECGLPPRDWDAYPEWISVQDWATALHRTGKWIVV